MPYDPQETIAAIASAPGGAPRGIVRISGPDLLGALAACFQPEDRDQSLAEIRLPRRVAGSMRIDTAPGAPRLVVPGELLLWPTSRSYTRQPTAEFHTIGSPPLLGAILERLGLAGVRPARPGEFTLRAFLAGRIDLTQAEAVLGVIDAGNAADLDAALDQMAGGLSRPLHALREKLLDTLAELEAGLDFVEEDIEFITRPLLRGRLAEAAGIVAAVQAQLTARDARAELPRVALVGPPNAGKSSLFNALAVRYSDSAQAPAIVSPQPGATRDYLSARLALGPVSCELIDTAGADGREDVADAIHNAAQQAAARQFQQADVRLHCYDATMAASCDDGGAWPPAVGPADLRLFTKIDLIDHPPQARFEAGDATLWCSSATGAGLDRIAEWLRVRLAAREDDGPAGATAATAARCAGSLQSAARALAAAIELTGEGGDELIAAEIRTALDGLGDVVGAICTDDILDRVFSQFCIGK
jgi:tRNA modification GTPase